MDSKSFKEGVAEELNNFRANPSSLIKKLENLRTALSRFNKNDPFLKDVDNFIGSLKTQPTMGTLKMNASMSRAAEAELTKFIAEDDYPKFKDGVAMDSVLGEYIEGYKAAHLLIDDGAEGPSDVICKILLNKADKFKKGRRVLMDSTLTFVGLAHGIKNDENVAVIILSDGASELTPKAKSRLPEGDLSELKQAFDFYDVNKIGKIDPKETCGAMKSLGFDVKNPTLYSIMKELDTPQYNKTLVDFETFACHIVDRITERNNREGLKRIFTLFIDDPNSETINMHTLKKICKELEEFVPEQELKEMLDKTAGNGVELTFQEFYDFMMNKYATA